MESLMPEGWEPVVPFDVCFDAQYGLEVLDGEPDVVRARVAVGEGRRNHLGNVHGGIYAAAAEALASRGTALAVMPQGHVASGMSNDTSVLEDVTDGSLHIEARLLARDAHAWLWTVDARDDEGRLCAHSRVTVAVR